MANNDQYQDDDQKTASYFDDIISPLDAAGIDPDEAPMNRDAVMAKVQGRPDYPGGADFPAASTPDYPGGAGYPARPAATPDDSSNGSGSSTVAPTTPPVKSWDDYTREGLEGQERATKSAEDSITALSKMPQDDPDLKRLQGQRAQAAQPIDSTLPQYRPTAGQKVMRALRGLGTNGIRGVASADYNAPNRQYQLARNTQTQNVANLDQQIAQARKNYEDASGRLKGLAAEQGKVATGYKDITTGATTAQGNDNKSELQAAQAELDRAKSTPKEPQTEAEIAMAASNAQQKGDVAAYKKYNGALSILKTIKQAGRDTTASDLAKAIQASEFGERETDKVNAEQESERKNRYAELDKNVTLKYNPQAMAQERAKIDQELDAKYSPRRQAVHDQVSDMLGLTKNGQNLNDKAAARAAKAKTGNKSRPPNGSTVNVDGKPMKVVGWNEKTNKPIVSAQ